MKNRSLGLLLAFVTLNLMATEVSADAARGTSKCASLVERLETARLRQSVDFDPQQLEVAARVKGFPLHFTSNPVIPFVWLSRPDLGTSYTVIKKGNRGFGFNKVAPIEEFTFLTDSDSQHVTLRSLDFSGDYEHLLATLVMTDPETKKSVAVLKLAEVKNDETGELELTSKRGLEIAELQNTREHLIVSPRPGTSEFWITDGGTRLTVVEVDPEQGLRTKLTISLDPTVIKAISKVQFFKSGASGYARVQKPTGEWILLPFLFTEEVVQPQKKSRSKKAKTTAAPEAAPETTFSFSLGSEKQSYPVADGFVRTAVHPTEPIIVIAYRDRLEAVGFNNESNTFTKLLDNKMDLFGAGHELMGVDFYWDGVLRKGKNSEGKVVQYFDGQVQGAVLIGDKNAQMTQLHWLELQARRKR